MSAANAIGFDEDVPSLSELEPFIGSEECFLAAEELAEAFKFLEYDDGCYLPRLAGGGHAWVKTRKGTIIDVTFGQFDSSTPVMIAPVGSKEHKNYLSWRDMDEDQYLYIYGEPKTAIIDAGHIVDRLLGESDPDEEMLKELATAGLESTFKWLKPGTSVSRGTSREESIIHDLVALLDSIDRPALKQAESSYEDLFEAWKRTREGSENPTDFEMLSQLANEILPDLLQKHCLPWTYFGSHPGDGTDIGCWPSIDGLQEAEGDTVTKMDGLSMEAVDFRRGALKVETPYVWIHGDHGSTDTDEVWDTAKHKLLWRY